MKIERRGRQKTRSGGGSSEWVSGRATCAESLFGLQKGEQDWPQDCSEETKVAEPRIGSVGEIGRKNRG